MTGDDDSKPGTTRRAFLVGTGAMAGALTLVGLAACSGDDSDDAGDNDADRGDAGDRATPTPSNGEPVVDADVPDEETIFGWISEVFDQGIRRPGYPADEWAETYIEGLFKEFGLENVRLEPVNCLRWEPGEVSLEVVGPTETRQLDAFPVPYSTPVDGLEVELTAFDQNNPDAAKDKAALCDVAFISIPADLMLHSGTLPEDRSRRAYDPDNTLVGHTHLTPSQSGMDLEPTTEAGAAAFIGSLKDHPGDPYTFYAPYDAHEVEIPAVFVRGSDGDWIHQQLAAGPVRIKLSVQGTKDQARTHNVVGELPGADDDIVIVGSHHDGPWASAVEDGSGIALVLAQAKYWASRPQEERPHRMVFVLHAAHMAGWVGQKAFVAEHADELERTVLEVHLEHAGKDVVEENGELVDTGLPVPRWFFTSRNPELEESVYSALEAEDLKRSLILAPDAISGRPPTDGVAYYDAGVPIMNFLGAPWYLFHEADTLDKVDKENLVGITRAVIRIIGDTAGTSAADMRAGTVAVDPKNPEHGPPATPPPGDGGEYIPVES
ncbi:MAG TPA: M28 family peptidase [Acidimicrobiales bacterium]